MKFYELNDLKSMQNDRIFWNYKESSIFDFVT